MNERKSKIIVLILFFSLTPKICVIWLFIHVYRVYIRARLWLGKPHFPANTCSQHSHPGSVWFLNLAVIFRVQIASLCRRLSDGVSPCCYANRAQTTTDQGGLLCLQEPVTNAEPFIFLKPKR